MEKMQSCAGLLLIIFKAGGRRILLGGYGPCVVLNQLDIMFHPPWSHLYTFGL